MNSDYIDLTTDFGFKKFMSNRAGAVKMMWIITSRQAEIRSGSRVLNGLGNCGPHSTSPFSVLKLAID